MIDQQTQALLSYNASNPDAVRRIVQERGLTQDQVAQALNLSPEAAARYGAAEAPATPAAGTPPANAPAAGSAGAPAGGTAIGQPVLDTEMGMNNPRPAIPMNPRAVQSPPIGQRQMIGQPGMRQEIAPAPMEKPPASMTKPAKLPADMKPQGMMDMRGQMRRPNTTALPGDEEFQRAFDRIRGARA